MTTEFRSNRHESQVKCTQSGIWLLYSKHFSSLQSWIKLYCVPQEKQAWSRFSNKQKNISLEQKRITPLPLVLNCRQKHERNADEKRRLGNIHHRLRFPSRKYLRSLNWHRKRELNSLKEQEISLTDACGWLCCQYITWLFLFTLLSVSISLLSSSSAIS